MLNIHGIAFEEIHINGTIYNKFRGDQFIKTLENPLNIIIKNMFIWIQNFIQIYHRIVKNQSKYKMQID